MVWKLIKNVPDYIRLALYFYNYNNNDILSLKFMAFVRVNSCLLTWLMFILLLLIILFSLF